MKEKKKILQFQKINFNYIYFLLFFISTFIATFISENLDSFGDEKTNYDNERNIYEAALQIATTYITTLSDYLAIIFFIINKYRSKGSAELDMKTIKLKTTQATGSFIYNDKYENELSKNYKRVHLYSFFVGFFDFIPFILLAIFYWTTEDLDQDTYLYYLNSSVVLNILLQYVMGFLVLKTKFYRHHYFSFILNSICFLILITLDIVNKILLGKYGIDSNYFFVMIAYLIFFALEYAFGKKALINGFLSIYSLLIQKAMYKTILMIAFSIIIYFINTRIFYYIGIIISKPINIALIIGLFIFGFLTNVFKWYVIDKFSPSHLPLPFIIEDLSYYFSFLIVSGGDKSLNALQIADLVTRIIIYIILFIGVLIHNEIVIINLCGLNLQTKLYLNKMLVQEELLSNTDNEEILKRYDTIFLEMEDKPEEENEETETNNGENKNDDDNENKEIKNENISDEENKEE